MKKWILNWFNTKMYGSDMNRMIMASKIPDQKVSLTRLKSIGFSPLLIFDVGGYKGEFSEMCLEIWNGAEVHLFEGLPDKIGPLREKFKGLKVRVNECLVGDKDASEVQFYADETASSVLYSEEVNYKKQLVTQSMCCLDSYISSHGNIVPDILKIDTQGFEYSVLKGSETYLSRIPVLLIECNFLEIYQNVKLAGELIAYLGGFGFVIYDVSEIHRRPLDNALVQMDFVFVKHDSVWRQDKRWELPQSA
jgi:FkbM family methyltransferase